MPQQPVLKSKVVRVGKYGSSLKVAGSPAESLLIKYKSVNNQIFSTLLFVDKKI